MKGKWVFLGNILIETGQIVIVDPVHTDAQLPGIDDSWVVIDLACGGLSDEPGSEIDPLKA